MNELLQIIADLTANAPRASMECLGLTDFKNQEDRIKQLLDEFNITNEAQLGFWIIENFGRLTVYEIVKKLNIPAKITDSSQQLIDQWFEYRRIKIPRPEICPSNLAADIYVLAQQISLSPDNFDAIELLAQPFEVLMRYICFYYINDISDNEYFKSNTFFDESISDPYKIATSIENLNLSQLCLLIGKQFSVNLIPYNPNSDRKVNLSNETINQTIHCIGALINGEPFDLKVEASLLSSYIQTVLQFWNIYKTDTIIPKGAIITEIKRSKFISCLICYDEFEGLLILKGVESTMVFGDNVLLAVTPEINIWASKLRTAPKGIYLNTPKMHLRNMDETFGSRFPSTYAVNRHKMANHVFISYSHADTEWLELLKVQFKPLCDNRSIIISDDTNIESGQKWHEVIREAITSASVGILLVSSNYFASDFIIKEELPSLLLASKTCGAVIIPVILDYCHFRLYDNISMYQSLNNPNEPLIKLSIDERKKAFYELSIRVMEILKTENK